MKEKLSEALQVRITPSLMQALEARAARLNLRVPDIVRLDLAQAIIEDPHRPLTPRESATSDLLAALEAIQERYATVSERGGIEVAITSELYRQIESAVAKAKPP